MARPPAVAPEPPFTDRPSQRLLARAGFTREGLERMSRETNGVRGDMICWSLLPADHTPAPAKG